MLYRCGLIGAVMWPMDLVCRPDGALADCYGGASLYAIAEVRQDDTLAAIRRTPPSQFLSRADFLAIAMDCGANLSASSAVLSQLWDDYADAVGKAAAERRASYEREHLALQREVLPELDPEYDLSNASDEERRRVVALREAAARGEDVAGASGGADYAFAINRAAFKVMAVAAERERAARDLLVVSLQAALGELSQIEVSRVAERANVAAWSNEHLVTETSYVDSIGIAARFDLIGCVRHELAPGRSLEPLIDVRILDLRAGHEAASALRGHIARMSDAIVAIERATESFHSKVAAEYGESKRARVRELSSAHSALYRVLFREQLALVEFVEGLLRERGREDLSIEFRGIAYRGFCPRVFARDLVDACFDGNDKQFLPDGVTPPEWVSIYTHYQARRSELRWGLVRSSVDEWEALPHLHRWIARPEESGVRVLQVSLVQASEEAIKRLAELLDPERRVLFWKYIADTRLRLAS